MTLTESQLRQKFVSVAQGWLGLKESDGSHMKILNIYNGHKPLARGYKMTRKDAWCAAMVSAASIEAGLTDIIPPECSCTRMIELLKKDGSFVENDAYVPLPGDILFYDWQDSGKGDNTGAPDHVGIVEKVAGGIMTIIEGNNSDMVKRRNIAVNGRYIRGFGVPKYASKADTDSEPNISGVLTVGDTVRFTGTAQYVSSYSGSRTVTARACTATVTAVASGRQHPYHLVGSGVEGWVDADSIEGVADSSANPETINIGDEVVFNGAVHYVDSYAVQGKACKSL